MKKILLFLFTFSLLAFYAKGDNENQDFVFVPIPRLVSFLSSSGDIVEYKKFNIDFMNLFEYPSSVLEKEDLSSKITVSSADTSLIKFYEAYFDGAWNYLQFGYKRQGAVGKVKVTVTILYNGITSVNEDFYIEIDKLICKDDFITLGPGRTKRADVLHNDLTIGKRSDLKIELVQAPKFGTAEVEFVDRDYINRNVINYTAGKNSPENSIDTLVYMVVDTVNHVSKTSRLIVNIEKSFYVTEVFEYLPAPGQFVNNKTFGVRNLADKIIERDDGYLVSLGGWGGYIIVGFDQPITNNPQNPYGVDFTICGNAFFADYGGSWSEPAAVMVMKDINGNGLPDDGEWYELAGSDYYFSTTVKNLEMTYYNPKQDERFFVPWRTNKGFKGVMPTNLFHKHSYFPDSFDFGCSVDSLTYSGTYTQLALDLSQPNYIEVLKPPIFGYADLKPVNLNPTKPRNPYYKDENGSSADGFDLAWAVDKHGNSVQLDTVHFVKIYGTTQADAGWLGEVSSEVSQVGITIPDTSYVPRDYYVHALNVTQLQVQKGTTCQYEGLLFKNGIPVQEGVDVWTSSNPTVATIDNNGLLTALENGKTLIKYQRDLNVPADSMLIDIVTIKDLILELEGNSSRPKDSVALTVGETIFITAQCIDHREDENGPSGGKRNRFVYETYNWTLSDSTVGSIDNGIFIGKNPGIAILTVQPKSKPDLNKTMVITVKEIPPISLKNDTLSIKNDKEKQGVLKIKDLFERKDKASVFLKTVSSNQTFLTASLEKNELKYEIANNRQSSFSDAELEIVAEYRDSLHTFKLIFKDETATGVQQLKIANKLILSPNPAKNSFTLNYSGKLEIFALGGSKVLEIPKYEKGQYVNIVSLSQGVYFVRIRNKEGSFTKQLIKL